MTNTIPRIIPGTPFDTGNRGEPKPWSHVTREELNAAEPIDQALLEDRFGKVDFDDDTSVTLATVWLERLNDQTFVLHVQEQAVNVLVQVHS